MKRFWDIGEGGARVTGACCVLLGLGVRCSSVPGYCLCCSGQTPSRSVLCLSKLRIRSLMWGLKRALLGWVSLCCYVLVLDTENHAIVAGSLRSFADSPLSQRWLHSSLWSLGAPPFPVIFPSALPVQGPFSFFCRLALCGRGLPGEPSPLPPPGHLLVPVLSPHLLLLCQMSLLPRQVLLP